MAGSMDGVLERDDLSCCSRFSRLAASDGGALVRVRVSSCGVQWNNRSTFCPSFSVEIFCSLFCEESCQGNCTRVITAERDARSD